MTFDPQALAREFDGAFALAHRELPPEIDLLAITLGDERYGLRTADIAGVFVDRAITRVPSPRRALLGIAGFRGAIVPVFDLAVLLGYPAAAAPRWIAIAAGAPVAFAFERFDGHVRAPQAAIATHDRPRAHVRDVLADDTRSLPLLDVASVLRALAAQDQ